ncbi:hypothetical protein SBV1_3630010 [Verrucomicrobia bacterium]|nr:hypothetical protein SBV1_3630010 [Verrucomicrobiota bacterium]
MTPTQRTALMGHWWPEACAAQGWDCHDRELRLRVLSDAVGRPLESASELDSGPDIDLVLRHFALLKDQVLTETADAGSRRRLNFRIQQLSAELGELNGKQGSPLGYALALTMDAWDTRDFDSLSLHQLEQLRNTLTDRLRAKRRALKANEPERRAA